MKRLTRVKSDLVQGTPPGSSRTFPLWPQARGIGNLDELPRGLPKGNPWIVSLTQIVQGGAGLVPEEFFSSGLNLAWALVFPNREKRFDRPDSPIEDELC